LGVNSLYKEHENFLMQKRWRLNFTHEKQTHESYSPSHINEIFPIFFIRSPIDEIRYPLADTDSLNTLAEKRESLFQKKCIACHTTSLVPRIDKKGGKLLWT